MNKLIRSTYLLLGCILMLGAYTANAQAPVANFSGTPTSSCSPVVVQYTDLSTNTPTSWSWNLGNGTTSSQQNPSTTYSTPGTYTVSMTATNGSGSNTVTKTSYITILPAPNVVFVATDTAVGCGSKTVQFSNSSVFGAAGSGTYYWDFGDGTNSNAQNPVHTYPSTGSYSVSLIVTNSAGCAKLLTKTNYVNVVPQTIANFTATNNNSCNAPITTSFTNTSTAGATYAWDFGDGGTSTTTNPTHTYTTSGSYTVRLIAIGSTGCRDTITKSAFVNIGALAASFTQSATSTCTNNAVSFTNTTTPGSGGCTWSFGDGSTSTLANPTHAYATAGTYTVKLVANYNNCADSTTHTVTVLSGPSTSFSGTPLASCSAPLTTTFTNNTTGAASYLWQFGDGGTSTSTSPSHTYSSTGTYNVTLISTSSNGCTDTLRKTSYVTIQPITASINGNPLIGCAPATGSFSASVISLVPVTSYSWTFGDGGTGTGSSVSHTYSTPGTYTITLTVAAGASCTATSTATVIVGTKPTAAFSATPTTSCVNSPVTFTSSSTGATSYVWLYGDGTAGTGATAAHSYDAPGTYTVTLIAMNSGCADTLVKTNYITVVDPRPDFSFAFPCTNRFAYTFTNTSSGATSYSWNFGDGSSTSTATNPSHTYAAVGAYNVTLTATSTVTGCTTSVTKVVNVTTLSSAFSTSDTVVCKGSSVTLTLGLLSISGTVSYNFGDGSPIIAFGNHPAASYAYPASGIYTVKVKYVDIYGCADSTTKTNHIRVHSPTADFTYTPSGGCGAMNVGFTDISVPSSGNTITNRKWIFGDGTVLNTTATSVSHTYVYAGNYSVKLIITETGGCMDSILKSNIILINRPTAQFTSPDVYACLGKSVSFVNSSTGSTSLTYAWSFGDLTSSTATAPNHLYADTGSYTVRLIATDGNGCKDTLIRPAYINVSTVKSGFTMSDSVGICPPFTVSFTNTSTGAASYLWLFGNGSSSSLVNPSATYTLAGTYTAKLVTINANGCRDTSSHSIYVGPSPTGTISYTPLNGCSPLSISFSTTSSNTSSITYDFDNGITQTTTASSITYTYTQPGVFIPKVIFNNGIGCSTFLQGADTIRNVKAYAGFSLTPTVACANTSIQFTDTSHILPTGTYTRSWSFGDGGTSTATNPSHVYTTAGTYTVRQIILSGNGCADTALRTVTINPLPLPVASNQTICTGTSVALPASGAATYSWSPATGLSCTTCATPTANPTTTTTYTLTGTSAFGCVASSSVVVTVNPIPVVSAGSAAAICSGAFTTLNATGANSYSWSPASGLSCTGCASPVATPSATTTYKVVGTSTAGCKDSATVLVTVNPTPVVVSGGNQFICPGGSTTLSATGATSYVWSPATGLSCTTCATPSASPTATTVYKVVGSNASGCKDSTTLTVTVNATPTVTVSGITAVCAGSSTTLTASGANTYSWSPATGLSCTTCASPTVTPGSNTTYTVTGTSGIGCSGTATVSVVVNPLPVVSAGPDTAICAGRATTLAGTGATSYSWSPASGLSCTSCVSPVATPTATTSYILTGTNATGCTNKDTVIVTVNPLPVVSAGPNVSVCPGGSSTLTATGAATYVWSPAATLSCTACASTTATPIATTTYKAVGTSALGCKDSANVTVTVNTTPTVSVSGTNTICTGGSTTLTATGANTYSWTPSTGLSCTSCASPVATPATTTTYTVTGSSGVGCTATTTYAVTVNPLPATNAGIDTAVCIGGSVALNATGATSYSWSPAAGLSCTTCASPVATPTATTTYLVTGTSAAGCTKVDTVVVTVKQLPIISAGSNTSVCPGGSATLTATGGVSYVWSPAATLSCSACTSTVATAVATTKYTVTGTGANGCVDTSSVTVAVNNTPVVTVSGIDTICAGSSTTLTASGAASFTWTPSTGLSCTSCASPVATPATTTTYTITGTSGVGCTATTTRTITVNPLPVVNAGVDTAFCAGSSVVLNATGAATYSWSPATGLSCTTCASPTASPAATTTYVVTGTSAAGCIKTDTVVVTVKTPPTVSAGTNTFICPGGSAVLTATGGVSYVWTPAGSLSCSTCASPTASPTSNTVYTVTGTGANGCTFNSSVTVTINANPTVTVTGNSAICAGGSTTLTASGAANFSWTPSTGLSCTTCANPTANPATTTTYTITGTSGVGCSATTTFTLTVNPLPVVSAGANKAICAGTSTTLTASGASTYSWSPATGLSCTTCISPTASPAATTTYTVTGTNSNGCVNTANVTVTVDTLPVVSGGSNVSICPGGNTTLNASGAATYVWTPSTGLSCTTCTSPVASPTASTTYVVTGTTAAGCIDTAHVTVSINATPVVTVSGTNAICAGGSTTLTASGAASFSWTPSTGLSCNSCASPVATPSATTTYTITGTSGVGCTGTTTFTVTVNPLPVVSAGADKAICAGANTTLTASGAATYVWTPASGLSCTNCVSPTATPGTTTTYAVIGTSAAGCVGTDTVVVTVNTLPIISAGPNGGVCPGGSITLSPSGGVSYVWNASGTLSCTSCTNPVATPTASSTTYTVTGTGANGCTAMSSVTIVVNPLPTVAISGNANVCAGGSTTLTASGASAYSWGPASSGLSCTTCTSPVVTPTATTTYKVIGTSGLGCMDSASILVTMRPLPNVTVDTPQTVCLNTPVVLTASGASTYSWSPAAGLSCNNCASPTATPAATTTYIVTGTDTYGCMDTAQTTITILALPNVNAGPDVSICKATSTTLTASGAVSYVWSPATGLSCTICVNPVASPAVTTAYVLSGTGVNGCVNTDTVNVNLYDQPPVNAGPDQTICAGQEAQLQASGANAYVWSPAKTLSCATCANPKAAPMQNTTYLLIGTDGHGCVDSDMVSITVIRHNPVEIGPGGEVCAGGSVQLNAYGGDSYTWYPTNALSCANCSNPSANPPNDMTYNVIIRQGTCFADTLSANVVIHPIPTVDAGPDQSMILGNSVKLQTTGTNIETYSWSPADGLSCISCAAPVAAPSKDMTYVVTVTSPFGCTAEDEVTVHVRCDGSQVWMPNTFTPNADGQNDRFYPHGKGILTIPRFRIYDRWGELLFERSNMPVNDKELGWDGTFKNQPLKPDVYVWIMDATCTNGEHVQTKGDISLIR